MFNNDELIYFFGIISIIVGAIFGILGTLIETKDGFQKTVKKTLAILAIIVAGSVALGISYLKRKKELRANEIAQVAKEKSLEESNKRYKEQRFNDSMTLRKIDSSLNFQLGIQKETQNITDELNASVGVQKKITSLQNEANSNINRTLNPLWPFAIHYTILIHAPSAVYLDSRNMLEEFKKHDGQSLEMWKMNSQAPALGELRNIEKDLYSFDITESNNGYQNLKYFEDIISEVEIRTPTESNLESQKSESELNLSFDIKAVLKSKNNLTFGKNQLVDNFGINIGYLPLRGTIKLDTYSNLITKIKDNGSIKSSLDLKNKKICLYILTKFPINNISGLSLLLGDNYAISYPTFNEKFEQITMHSKSVHVFDRIVSQRYGTSSVGFPFLVPFKSRTFLDHSVVTSWWAE